YMTLKCLRCGGEIHRNDRHCHTCGSDVAIMTKLKKISDKYYNRAIELVKFSNLTDALHCLKLSIGFNKHNIEARNLIGLVYLETGEVGEAFKHWLLSASYKKTDNKAVGYMEYTKENIVEFDKMDMGIKLYNEALSIMKTINLKNEDTDKIRRRLDTVVNKLKGAINFNPRLLKAVNLMTLCYIILGERSKALDLTKSVLYTDTANPQASLHYNILCPDRTRPPIKITGNIEQKKKSTEVQPPPMEEQGIFTSTMFVEAAAFLLGIAACAAVFCFLVIPGIIENNNRLPNSGEAVVSEAALAETDSETAGSDSVSSDIAAKEADIKKAKELYDNFYYIDACSLIFGMDTKGISAESLEIYNSIIYNVTVNGANALLDLGQKSYNEGDSESAEIFLKKALEYSSGASDEADELFKTKYTVLFYLGRIAMDSGDDTQAIIYFSEVKENHPDKRYQNYAESYLTSLNAE
ncbi:MAG: hypothetical protein LUD81_00875, partial [Clostridiales bacterium]|nr:hypothetical protein [Clostridiales bacterium]